MTAPARHSRIRRQNVHHHRPNARPAHAFNAKALPQPLRRTHASPDAAPILELMDAARSYGHRRDVYLVHLERKSRPGKPCASNAAPCHVDAAAMLRSPLTAGSAVANMPILVAVLVIGGAAPSRLRRAADVLGSVKHWPKPRDLVLQNCGSSRPLRASWLPNHTRAIQTGIGPVEVRRAK